MSSEKSRRIEEQAIRSFVGLGQSAEILLSVGCHVWVENQSCMVLVADGHPVARGYRDGASWKFKRETIQDYADKVELEGVQS